MDSGVRYEMSGGRYEMSAVLVPMGTPTDATPRADDLGKEPNLCIEVALWLALWLLI